MYKQFWKDKIFIIFVIFFTLGILYSYIIEPKINKYTSSKAEIQKHNQTKRKKYDWTDANEKEIYNIFEHVGFYYDVDQDGNDEEVWSATVKTMYNETEIIKDSNAFAKKINDEILKLKLDDLRDLDEDIIDLYKTAIFIGINAIDSSNYSKNNLVELERLECDKVFIINYDDNYNTKDEDLYRIIYAHFPKLGIWVRALSSDKGEGDGKYYELYKDIVIDEKVDFKEISKTNVNKTINDHRDFFDLLISYRNDVYYDYKISEMKKLEEKYKVPVEYEPAIGMTKQQVLSSTWGSPKSKNITENVYGIHEQWVYGNGKYIYFDNGEVTTIQR